LKEDLIRLNNAPLVARLAGLPQLGRGQQIELQITGADELALELEARYVSLIDAVVEASEIAEEPEANQAAATELEATQTESFQDAATEARNAATAALETTQEKDSPVPNTALATPAAESSNTGSGLTPPLI
jgi:exoribonuclease-2